MYEDDGTSNDYLEGGYAKTTYVCREAEDAITFEIQPIQGTFDGVLEKREYDLLFHSDQKPLRIFVNGEKIDIDSVLDNLVHVPVSHNTQERVEVELFFRL